MKTFREYLNLKNSQYSKLAHKSSFDKYGIMNNLCHCKCEPCKRGSCSECNCSNCNCEGCRCRDMSSGSYSMGPNGGNTPRAQKMRYKI